MADTHGKLVESICSFCDIGQFEERLIAKVDGFYVIATLGQITDGGHVLLLPIEHTLCMGAFTKEQVARGLKLSQKICRVLTREYKLQRFRELLHPVTIFEHGIVGQTIKHAHAHFLPVIVNLTPRILNDFPGSAVERIKYVGQIQNLYADNPRPYLFWATGQSSDTKERVCWNPPAPSQYLRIIAAGAIGRPERADWRRMDRELDGRLRAETVRLLKPYFV